MSGTFERQNKVAAHIVKTMVSMDEGANVGGQSLFEGVIGEDGKIQQRGREMAKSILNEAMIRDISLVELEFYSGLHFDGLIKNSPDEAQAIRKVRTSLRLQIAYESARRIVNSEAGKVIVTNNGLERNPRENIIGYANRLVAEHNREAIDLRDAERRKHGIPDPTTYESKAKVRRQNQVERLKLADQIRAETEEKIKDRHTEVTDDNNVLIAEALGAEGDTNPSVDANIDGTTPIITRNGLQGFFDRLRQHHKPGRAIITSLALAIVLLITNRASSQINGMSIDYNNSMSRQPQPINAPMPSQENGNPDFIAKLVEEAVTDSVTTDNEAIEESIEIVTSETGKVDNGTQDPTDTFVDETQTTEKLDSDNTTMVTEVEKEAKVPVILTQAMASEDNVTFVSQAYLEAQKNEDLRVNEAISDLESIGFETEINGDLITARFYTPLPRESYENYRGKDRNMNVGVQIFNENAPEVWEPDVTYGLVGDNMVNVWDSRHVMATYIKDGAPVSLNASGVCAIPSALGAVQDEINRMARSSGEIPQIVTFANNSEINNNQPHSHEYASYTPVDQRGNKDDWSAGYTIVQYTKDGKPVGKPEYYSGVSDKFRSYWEERGFEVKVRFELGYYENGNTVPVPSYQDDIDFTNTMLSFDKPTIVGVAFIDLKPIPNWESSQTANVEFDSQNVSGNLNPDFTTSTTTPDSHFVYALSTTGQPLNEP